MHLVTNNNHSWLDSFAWWVVQIPIWQPGKTDLCSCEIKRRILFDLFVINFCLPHIVVKDQPKPVAKSSSLQL